MAQSLVLLLDLLVGRRAVTAPQSAKHSPSRPLRAPSVIREVMPRASIKACINIAFLAVLAQLLFEAEVPDFYSLALMIIATFYTGLLTGVSIKCASFLVEAEAGTPDPDMRSGLVRHLSLYSILPLLTAIVA